MRYTGLIRFRKVFSVCRKSAFISVSAKPILRILSLHNTLEAVCLGIHTNVIFFREYNANPTSYGTSATIRCTFRLAPLDIIPGANQTATPRTSRQYCIININIVKYSRGALNLKVTVDANNCSMVPHCRSV